MRYITGKYTKGRERGFELQNDGKIWHQDTSPGKFTTVGAYLDANFNQVVDGIYFKKVQLGYDPLPVYRFMLPETHFLFNEHMISATMYYDQPNHKRDEVMKYAQKVIVDIIKQNYNTKI